MANKTEANNKDVKDVEVKALETEAKEEKAEKENLKKEDDVKKEETSTKEQEEKIESSNDNDDNNNDDKVISIKEKAKSTRDDLNELEKVAISTNDMPDLEPFSARIIVVTSGKGGVGKTTSAAAIATGLAQKGHKTCVIDFDVGLRNLDLIMGCERRVVYDFINVLQKEASLNQALIKDKRTEDLFILAASQNKDKSALTYEGVGRVLRELDEMGFKYIICDSPAGIETGALLALYYADEAIVTTNPEVSSVRDSDRIIGILNSKSRRAVKNWEPVEPKLLLTRYDPARVNKGEMLSISDIQDLLNIPLLGVIPESEDVLASSNAGIPIIHQKDSIAGQAYSDTVCRLLGENIQLRFTTEVKKGFLSRLFSK